MSFFENRYDEITSNFEKMGLMSPNQMRAWYDIMEMIEREGALSSRRKELIAVALSVYVKCDWCIALHVKKALQLGARKLEVVDAAWIAVLMGGDPALMHTQRVLHALEEFKEIEEEELILCARAQLAVDCEYKKLYYRLIDYVKCICNETETLCRGNTARRRLALNIAESDGSVLVRFVSRECERRGWKELPDMSILTGYQKQDKIMDKKKKRGEKKRRIMETRYEEIFSNFEQIGLLSPDQMEAWQRFMSMTEEKGAIDPKNKELITVALSVYAKCDWCIALSVKKALQLGARKQEIIEAVWVAIRMGGGPVIMYAQRVLQALEEFHIVDAGKTRYTETSLKTEELDGEFKKLYQQLLNYVNCICDEVEVMCNKNPDRLRLALNIAESDGSVLELLVMKECDKRGWEEPLEYESIST